MDRDQWVRKIKRASKNAGTYMNVFDATISDLAEILAERDKTKELYEEHGGMPVIKHTNKGGATNIVKNPMLVLWDELNKTALAYWRELGLTPAGLKKIKDDSFTKSAKDDEPNDLMGKLMRKRERDGKL